MALIRFGEKGLNLAHIVRWVSREVDDTIDDGDGGRLLSGGTYPAIWIEFINGHNETYTHDEAVVLRTELEVQASDILRPPNAGFYP